MDVAILVTKSSGPYGPNKKLKVKGQWVNLGYEKSYALNIPVTLDIQMSDISNWSWCTDEFAECFRYVEWVNYK